MGLSLHVECPSPEVSVNHILSYDVAIYKLSIPTYIHLLVVVVVLEWGGGDGYGSRGIQLLWRQNWIRPLFS